MVATDDDIVNAFNAYQTAKDKYDTAKDNLKRLQAQKDAVVAMIQAQQDTVATCTSSLKSSRDSLKAILAGAA